MLERALYNGVLAGISLSGDRFFYMNPLEANADSRFPAERKEWFGCSCCPTNFCRFLPQLGELCWVIAPDASEVRLLIPAASTLDLPSGLRLRVDGEYPYGGTVRIKVAESERLHPTAGGASASRQQADNNKRNFALSLRIPGWCRSFTLAVNGRRVRAAVKDGFVSVKRGWAPGDAVQLDLAMPVCVVRAHTNAADEAGRVALMRGPLVYALESVDNGPGLHRYEIDRQDVAGNRGVLPRIPFQRDGGSGRGGMRPRETRDGERGKEGTRNGVKVDSFHGELRRRATSSLVTPRF